VEFLMRPCSMQPGSGGSTRSCWSSSSWTASPWWSPARQLIVALSALSLHSGEPNLWILGLTALVGAMAGDNMAYMLGRKIGLTRWKWMRRPKVQKAFAWAQYELDKRGAVLIFTARYIPWGRVAVNYVAGQTGFRHRPSSGWTPSPASPGWPTPSASALLASSVPWLHHNPLLSASASPWCSPSSWASSSTTPPLVAQAP
jgi:membrane-associated protein